MAHRIILADTQVIFRTGAARVLAMEEDLRVVAQCADFAELVESIAAIRSSIVVFPSSLAGDVPGLMDRIDSADSKSVVIVEHGTRLDADVARRADGVMPRSVTGQNLVECLRQVGAGARCVQGAKVKLETAPDRAGARILQRLTPKELQIVALVAEGGKNRDIAQQLGTKEQVIKNYLRSIYDKTGASDRLELALFTAHHRTLAEAARCVREELTRSAGNEPSGDAPIAEEAPSPARDL